MGRTKRRNTDPHSGLSLRYSVRMRDRYSCSDASSSQTTIATRATSVARLLSLPVLVYRTASSATSWARTGHLRIPSPCTCKYLDMGTSSCVRHRV
jgi:hypothetical protein